MLSHSKLEIVNTTVVLTEDKLLNYIKSLHIDGFKKFISLDVQFNEHMNILVGENEAGKSTLLDALKTVLNQQY